MNKIPFLSTPIFRTLSPTKLSAIFNTYRKDIHIKKAIFFINKFHGNCFFLRLIFLSENCGIKVENAYF
jgi:hypothetical protein